MKNFELAPIRPEKIHIRQIALVRGNLNATDSYLESPTGPAGVNLTIGHMFRFNFEKKVCLLRLDIELRGENGEKEPVGLTATYTIDFTFEIENFEDYYQAEEKTCRVSRMMGGTLLGISFSTARGILMERLNGTLLSGFLLPVVNAIELIKDKKIEVELPMTSSPLAPPSSKGLAKSSRKNKKANL